LKKILHDLERNFDKLTSLAIAVIGHSITFILVFCLVIYWFSNPEFYQQSSTHKMIGELILGITFLSLFIIQKTFNQVFTSLHLKLNELVFSHETAKNSVMNAENKTEREIIELQKDITSWPRRLRRKNNRLIISIENASEICFF